MKKNVFLLSFLFLTTLSIKSYAGLEFWCEPQEPGNHIEAILAHVEDNSSQLAIYTTGDTWGTVDERIVTATRRQIDQQVDYIAEGEFLSVLTQMPVGDLPDFVHGNYINSKEKISLMMTCELL
jgi:hypothetical protein